MAISLGCTGCGRLLQVKDEFAGKRIRCPHCQEVQRVPSGAIGFAHVPSSTHQREVASVDKKIAPLAYAAFFLAVATMVIWCLGPVTLVVGLLAIKDIKNSSDKVGLGRAKYGVVWGIIATVLMCFCLLVVVVAILERNGR